MRTRQRILAVASLALLVGGCDVGTFGDPPDGGGGDVDSSNMTLSYNGQISADVAVCAACHGSALQQGNYRTDSYAAITGNGSDGTPNVIPNDTSSKLIVEMDPNAAPRADHTAYATAARLTLYTNWINAGAPEQ